MQETVARKLRVLRAQEGLTLRQAAKSLGVTPGTLSELERGTRHAQDITLARIAKGYGVPVEELLEEPAVTPAGKVDAPGETDEDEARRVKNEIMRNMREGLWRLASVASAAEIDAAVKEINSYVRAFRDQVLESRVEEGTARALEAFEEVRRTSRRLEIRRAEIEILSRSIEDALRDEVEDVEDTTIERVVGRVAEEIGAST